MTCGAVVLGVPVDDVTMDEALDRCAEFVEVGRRTGRSHQVATANVDFLVNAQADAELRLVLQRSDLVVADGMPVVWGSKLLGAPLRERVSGADLVPELAGVCARSGYRMMLFGAAPGVAERAAEALRERHPGAQVVGWGGPFFDRVEDMDPSALDRIRVTRPDVLCVALGHPKQELWIDRYRAELQVPVLIGVGGTLDFLAGSKSRAPEWMRRAGLEWSHRLATEPKRLARRYARDFVVFGPRLAQQAWWTRGDHVEVDGALQPAAEAHGADGGRDGRADAPLTLDLAGVDRLDRRSLVALVDLVRRARAAGREVAVVSVSGPAARSLARLGLDHYLLAPAPALPAATTEAREEAA